MKYKFATDRTLGKLARWLRVLGYDTVFESDAARKGFYDRLEVDRILLTRIEKLLDQITIRKKVFITSNFVDDQLRQVIEEIGIHRDEIRPFSRCIECNLAITEIKKADIIGLVPDYIWETLEKFNHCRQCGRIFWAGSHVQRSLEKIEMLFN